MTISNNWPQWIGELSKMRKVIALEMQGHGRTADIKRDFSYENLADDVTYTSRGDEAAGQPRTWREAHRALGGKKTAVVALARRLAGILFAMMRDGTEYPPPKSAELEAAA